MDDKRLTNDLIADPSLYRLGLLLGEHTLDVALTSRVTDTKPIGHRIKLNNTAGSDVAARLEEAIYDNPLLTADFNRVDFVVDTNRFFLIPAERAKNPDSLAADVNLLYPDSNPVPVVNFPEPERTAVVTMIDPAVNRFVGRTFHGTRIVHRLAAAARYHVLRNHLGNTGKLHVSLRNGSTDIIAIGHQGLLLVNTFVTPAVDDAVYYTLAVAQQLEFDNNIDRVLVSGPRRLRDNYIRQLRRFVSFAMPEIFPPTLASTDPDSPDSIPFSLAVIPLCE